MALVQEWPFFQLYFLRNISQKSVFYDILEQKKAFLRYKNKKFKNSKNWHFSKAVNPWFWTKNGHFSNFFFRQYRPGKRLLRYSRTKKTPFKTIKKEGSKSLKIEIFPKGLIHGFGPKMANFPTFFFRQYKPKQCLLRYSRTKKSLSRL